MNKRFYQYPFCFLRDDQESDYKVNYKNKVPVVTSSSPIAEILAESEFKCVYDRDKNDLAEIYISCIILEKAFHLGANLTDTVKDVKNHIKRLEKIPTALLHLFFNDVLLRDTSTLEECRVTNKSMLTMGIKLHSARCAKCKKVFVPSDGKPVRLTLGSLTGNVYEATLSLLSPVEALKELIEEKYKVYPDHQLIIYNDKKLEDDVVLEEYGVTSQSNLFLLLYQYDNCSFCYGCAKAHGQPTITLKFLDNTVKCALHPEYTVRKLKEMSYQYLYHIHPDLQQIVSRFEELPDDKTLHECGVGSGAKLEIKLRFDRRKCDKCEGPLS